MEKHIAFLAFVWATSTNAQIYPGDPITIGKSYQVWDPTLYPVYDPMIPPDGVWWNYNSGEQHWNNTASPVLASTISPWINPTEDPPFIRDLALNNRQMVHGDTLGAHNTRINATRAYAVQRANHTGTQAISTVTGLQTALDGKLSAEVDGSVTNEIELPSQTGNNGKVLGTTGSNTVWVDPTGATWSFNNAPGRTIQTVAAAGNGWQVSASRPADVSYSVTIGTTVSLSGNSTGYVVLEIASTNSSTAGNWTEIARVASGQSGTLVIGLVLNQTGGGNISGSVPAGYYARVRSVNTAGTPSFTMNSGQEVTK